MTMFAANRDRYRELPGSCGLVRSFAVLRQVAAGYAAPGTTAAALLAALLALSARGPFPPSPVAAQPLPGALDEELLRDPQADPIDPIERELFAPQPQERPGEPADETARESLEAQLERELGAAGVSAGDNPLLEVSRWMRLAEQRLADNDAGEPTQTIQEQVLAALDQLVRRAEPPPGNAGAQHPRDTDEQPDADDPDAAEGAGIEPGGADAPEPSGESDPDAEDPAGRPAQVAPLRGLMERLWGELPERERERLLQAPVEQFLPKYETLIERYYRALARSREGEQ